MLNKMHDVHAGLMREELSSAMDWQKNMIFINLRGSLWLALLAANAYTSTQKQPKPGLPWCACLASLDDKPRGFTQRETTDYMHDG